MTIQDQLAATWESHMHDGNGAHVVSVFLAVLKSVKESGRPLAPFEVQDQTITAAFKAFEDDENGGFLWACASNAVAAMMREFGQWLTDRRRQHEPRRVGGRGFG